VLVVCNLQYVISLLLSSVITELNNKLTETYGDIVFDPQADSYIGISLQGSPDLRTFTLSQRGLIEKTIAKYLKDEQLQRSSDRSGLLWREKPMYESACDMEKAIKEKLDENLDSQKLSIQFDREVEICKQILKQLELELEVNKKPLKWDGDMLMFDNAIMAEIFETVNDDDQDAWSINSAFSDEEEFFSTQSDAVDAAESLVKKHMMLALTDPVDPNTK
jgi:hypothetical protein